MLAAMLRGWHPLLAFVGVVATSGCGDDAPWEPAQDEAPAFDDEVVPVFADNCSCHLEDADGTTAAEQEGPAPVGSALRLDAMTAHDQLVGAPSEQVEGMARVTPQDLDDSYLWRKIHGTHLAAGGSGEAMPRGEQLSASDVQILRDWIAAGAPK
jgi:hypothetical protein